MTMVDVKHRFSRIVALGTPRRLWVLCAILGVICLLAAVRIVLLEIGGPAKPVIAFARQDGHNGRSHVALYPSGGRQEVEQSLGEASLSAELLGVVISGEQSFASLRVQDSKLAVYRAGDELARGVTLETIEPHRVVVRERGTLRHISLKPLADNGGSAISLQASGGPGEVSDEVFPSIEVSTVLTEDGAAGIRVDRKNPQLQVLDVIADGDVILAVDGMPLTAVMTDKSTLARLTGEESLTLTLLRDGVEQEVEVSGDAVRSIMTR